MIDWSILLVAPIATWGIAYLISKEDGPFGIFYRLRTLNLCPEGSFKDVQDYMKCLEKNTPKTAKHPGWVRLRNMFLGLVIGIFDCIYCASPYAAVLVVTIIAASFNFKINLFASLLLVVYSFSVSVIFSGIWERFLENVENSN